jgi:hypothetical protein
MNWITSSIPHSGVGILLRLARGDSELEVSPGVVDVAASCSGGGLRLGGVGLMSHDEHSFFAPSKPAKNDTVIVVGAIVATLTEEVVAAAQG